MQATQHIAQGGGLHIVAHAVLGQGVKALVRALHLQVLANTVLRTDDKFFGVALHGIIHNAGGRTYIIRLFHNGRHALRVHQKQRPGMLGLGRLHIPGSKPGMGGAAAAKQLKGLLRHLARHIVPQIAVRDKENFVVVDLADHLFRTGRSNAHIAHRLKLRRGVDIRHHGIIRVILFHLLDHFPVHLLRHRAAGVRIAQQHPLVRRQHLHCLRHKAHAAHEHRLVGHGLGQFGQGKGVAGVIRHL